ncbi:MAG: DUF2520 domain-containing protein [Bacteroidales bacterium]|nr:DUF2520 domain-containing protein [Bacteroidales bacterium]
MIAIIGTGNVAHWVASRLKDSQEFPVAQVYGRRMDQARALAGKVGAQAIDDLSELRRDCDLYLFTVKDDAYREVLEKVPFTMPLAVHTAGSVSQRVFEGHAREYGVLYPLQTISKNADLEGLEVPLCVEDDRLGASCERVWRLATALSDQSHRVGEDQRAVLHLAAVFACNFSNAMASAADEILAANGLDFKMLLPLMRQTLDKLQELSPVEAQTGPAVRGDRAVMDKHIRMLEDERLRNIYREISEYIRARKG